MKTAQLKEAQTCAEHLVNLFEGDDAPRVLTLCRRVSASGMSRKMSLFYIKDNRILNITYNAGKVLGWPLSEVDGSRTITVQGGGMDMGFHTVYSLSRALYTSTHGADTGYYLKQDWL